MTQVNYTYESNPEYTYENINMAVLLQLQEGQEVWLRLNGMSSISGADSGNGMFSWFSGHLAYALWFFISDKLNVLTKFKLPEIC